MAFLFPIVLLFLPLGVEGEGGAGLWNDPVRGRPALPQPRLSGVAPLPLLPPVGWPLPAHVRVQVKYRFELIARSIALAVFELSLRCRGRSTNRPSAYRLIEGTGPAGSSKTLFFVVGEAEREGDAPLAASLSFQCLE